MSVLDRVVALQAQGLSEGEINKKLRDEGAQVAEINDALSQAKIKQAVSSQEDYSGMEQSIMAQQEPAAPSPTQDYSQYQQPYQQYAPQDYQYQQQPQLDTDTISEIAEQVFQEKFSEFTKKTGDLVLFRNEVRDKIKDLDERLKRIEGSLDQIQKAIIGKIGEYGENMSGVKKDLDNIHDTMSKLMNPLIDNYQQLRKMAGK